MGGGVAAGRGAEEEEADEEAVVGSAAVDVALPEIEETLEVSCPEKC